jgi:hypothetical protein
MRKWCLICGNVLKYSMVRDVVECCHGHCVSMMEIINSEKVSR